MPARRRLRHIRPTGGLEILRMIGFGLALALAAVAIIALPFATHVTEYGPEVHRTFTETACGPWLIAIAILCALVSAARGRLIRTLIVTPLVGVGAFVGGLWVALQHLLMETTSNGAEAATLVCFFSLFWVAPALFVLQWIVVLLERKKLERQDPVFPTARVVERA